MASTRRIKSTIYDKNKSTKKQESRTASYPNRKTKKNNNKKKPSRTEDL
jgi:hypothetical protein